MSIETQVMEQGDSHSGELEGMRQPRPSVLSPQLNYVKGAGTNSALEVSLWLNSSHSPSATAYNLSLVRWDVVAHLSFGFEGRQSQSREAADQRASLYGRWLTEICKAFGLRRRNLRSYSKVEYGPFGDNPHYHGMIACEGPKRVSPTELAADAKRLWTESSPWRDKFGSVSDHWQAIIEPVNAELTKRGILYATKDEFDAHRNLRVPEEILSDRLRREITKRNAVAAGELQFAV